LSSQINVLLVEDSHFFRDAATSVLQSYGFTVFAAGDGEQAIRIAARQRLDIVLLDLMLPKVQGLEVLRRLRQYPQTSRVPVIIVTTVAPQRHNFLPYAPVDFVPKDNAVLYQLPQRIGKQLELLKSKKDSDHTVFGAALAVGETHES
jgi:CheY-like chemotaxis protein